MHGLKRIVVIEHKKCSACLDFLQQSNTFPNTEEVEECEFNHQLLNMQSAKNAIMKEFPSIAVDLFFYDLSGCVSQVDTSHIFELV